MTEGEVALTIVLCVVTSMYLFHLGFGHRRRP